MATKKKVTWKYEELLSLSYTHLQERHHKSEERGACQKVDRHLDEWSSDRLMR